MFDEPNVQPAPTSDHRGPPRLRPAPAPWRTRSAAKTVPAIPAAPPIIEEDEASAAPAPRDGRPTMPPDPDLGRRIDAVHQQVQLHLAESCPREEPLVVICALGYEIVRLVQTLERVWTPKALDRFLVDFTRVLRRHILERRML
jgi:hypothetical protein